jgi:hypothetical protein
MNKLSYEYIKDFIESKGCKLLSDEYKDQEHNLNILFACGHEGQRSFSTFKYSKNICSRCSGVKQYSYEEAKEVIENNGYLLLSNEYINCKKYLDIGDVDGYKYTMSLDKFINNIVNRKTKLAKFDMQNPYTMHNVRLYLKINNTGFCVFENEKWGINNGKMTFIDDNEYKYYVPFISLQSQLKSGSHPGIFDISNIYTIENIENWIKINNKPFLLVKGQTYKGADKKLKFKCLKCPEEEMPFERTIVGLTSRGNKDAGCNFCNTTYIGNCNNLQYQRPDIALEWDYEKNYPILPNKIAAHTSKKYWWICSDCGNGYCSSVAKRTGNEPRGCPVCHESNMEKRIRKFLTNNKIESNPQYRFDDCRNIIPLPFDFYIKEYNVVIEANGIQHFQIVEHFGGEEGFKKRLINDNIKRNYCKDNNIKLIEISYKDYKNIYKILTQELNLQRKEVSIIA